jgi:RNA polymerase sigma-70 factor (ECF subfamily)
MTSSEGSVASVDDLVRHAAWLRRMALGLMGDADEAADVAQEAIVAAWEHQPRGADPRPWLATVARNRARDWLRRRSRRTAHEQATRVTPPAAPPGAAELVGHIEIHRMIAEVVDALEEPFRQTVVLRYYDGLSSAQIARRLGVPAGTVRWRLKQGLDRVRAELDRRCGGDREAWMRMLLPLRPGKVDPASRVPAGGARGGLPWPALAGGLVAVGVAVAASGRCPRQDAPGPPVSSAAGVPPVRAPIRPGHPGAPPTARAFASLHACLAELRPLHLLAGQAENAWLESTQAGVVFEQGAPNPEAEQALEPLVSAELGARGEQGASHQLECRTWACRVVVVEPTAELAVDPDADWVDPLLQRLHGGGRIRRDSISHIGEPVRDPLSGAALGQQVMYVKLAHSSGAPAGASPAWLPPDSRAACEAEVTKLRAGFAIWDANRPGEVGATDRFGQRPLNAALAADVRRQIARLAPEAAASHPVECRERVCRISNDSDNDFEETLHRDPWFRLRAEDYAFGTEAMFVRLADHPRADGEVVVRQLVQRIERSSLLDDCGRRHAQPGRLKVVIVLHGTALLLRMGGAVEPLLLTVQGEDADRPLGVCVRAGIDRMIQETALPAEVTDAAALRWVTFAGGGDWNWTEER